MNEEELKKEIEKWSRGCNVNIDFPKGLKYCDGINLCKVCKTNLDLYEAELRGFQKGKLEICYNLLNSFEKRIKDIEELPINHPLKIEQMNFLAGMREITKEIYILIESIEQLQKEIKVSGDSLTEFWDNPEDDRWDKEEEKQ